MYNDYVIHVKLKKWGDEITFNLGLQSEDGFILISDRRNVNTSTSGIYSDEQHKLYKVNEKCGLMVSCYPYTFYTFFRDLVQKNLIESDDLDTTIKKIKNVIYEQRQKYEEIYGNSQESKVFKNLNNSFKIILCGYNKDIPKLVYTQISSSSYPFLSPIEEFTRYKHMGETIGKGYVIGGIEDDRIDEFLRRKYKNIFLPSLSDVKEWVYECYKEMTQLYCTVGGKPQIATISPRNGFKFISDEEIEQNKSKWANVI